MSAEAVFETVDSSRERLYELAQELWETPELGLHECESSELLVETLREEGFEVETDVGGMPTAFVATYGETGPKVGILGEFDALPEEGVTVTLLEQFDSVAPNFPERFQRAVHDQLVERGVDVRTGATVERATADAVHLTDGTTIEYDQFIWTGGIRGPDAMAGDRPVVRSTLSLDRTTFVVGDAARMVDDDGEAAPASSQSAIRAARVAAENIDRMVDHLRDGEAGDFDPRLDRFDFDSPGWLVSVGDGAVAQVGPTVFTGRAALALKATVGGGYLSSVGAVRNAVDLVNRELGIDPGDE